MRAIIVTSILLGLSALTSVGAAGITTKFRGKTLELTPGMTPAQLAPNRGPSPSKIDPTLDPPRLAQGDDDSDWLSPPDNGTWGYIDDDGVPHGVVDLVWAFEGVPSFDGTNYNTLSPETLDLFELLTRVNVDLPKPQDAPLQGRAEVTPNTAVEVRSSLTKRATVYACHTNHGALKCNCVTARNALSTNPWGSMWVDVNKRAGYVVGTCAIVVNTKRPGWAYAWYYQMVADAIPIIDNCWAGVNECAAYRSGVSQASNTWPKTCVCNVNNQNAC
jgi:hypothetical protein